ncbi:N-acetylmuramoyl-L-alanine amidase [uncultured Clostridium sp.]|uniref:N-acetylmuramoyl-L-alanine amidase n=1 Tax=uncultured Clostridium sp. TaxID=59620 RepID=UPI0025FD37B2|nr:N-acetylmuramoyl-L-alanine amidase [uncultured Clostridium sp.]MDU4883957.1 N-acetylmuramoyl-L-alanine amidase [Clostridium celatum]MDU7077190.1 N-acetylmuramoyl-L-alanine amidase [Clostridium celatum]
MIRKLLMVFISIVLMLNLITPISASIYEEDGKIEGENKSFTVCIDPGHQEKGDPKGEPIAPGSGNKKPRVSSGTAGIATKKAEHVVNLEAAMILKDLLVQKNYNVIMTRETADVNISNAERAEIANNANANITIRIHCDSINDSGKTGATILVPAKNSQYTKNIYCESNKYAEILKKSLQNNNIKVNGVFERNDITGFNWSKVPVIILEMGFMSNYNEDKMLSDPNYQKLLMESVSESIDKYSKGLIN